MSGRLRRKLILDKVVFFWKDKTENHENIEAIVRNYGSLAPKRYNFSDIKNMTKSFSNKLGQGGYGDVYKGMLPDGPLVAVKVLKESKGNGEEFMNEVANISRTSHVNIVTLLGFCCERNKRALIYEFMPNGSLDKFIYDQESSMNLKMAWKTKFQIAVGIARGLEYLHRGCSIRIVHFDIKPQNILLNEDFCPKISDFGLAKQSKNKESIISMLDARGTIGYIAPEVYNRNFGEVSHKSDVYSYGMMILEMVGGRKNIDVTASRTDEIYSPHWLFKHPEPGKEEDFKLHGVVIEEEEEMAKKMIIVSSWCIQTFPSDRPSMTKVVEMLEGSLENLQIPPKPSTSSPTMSPPKHFPCNITNINLNHRKKTSGKPGDM
ncbi:PR5-like receptor kinase [Pistacia vera]|uniref:PR5-like receptor kinase n=1 Tax=Pistacia vera TaxID=55513 RepID=UPI0012638105|nr:PR5-like receptor kinase [Pistacia vera]